jgi:hypothetical protein
MQPSRRVDPRRAASAITRRHCAGRAAEDEEREPEHPEGVLGAQFVVLDVHVELKRFS